MLNPPMVIMASATPVFLVIVSNGPRPVSQLAVHVVIDFHDVRA